MVAREPLFRKIFSFKGNGMSSQKDKLKEATAFFGVERMAQLESAIKEQSNKTKKASFKNGFAKKLKIASILVLIGYSAGLTYLLLEKSKMSNAPLISKNIIATPIELPRQPATELSSTAVTIEDQRSAVVKLKVKKGDSLSSIAQKIIKSNGAKNTYENRKMVIEQLKNKNEQIQNDQSIKSGWTLLSLTKTETLEICKN